MQHHPTSSAVAVPRYRPLVILLALLAAIPLMGGCAVTDRQVIGQANDVHKELRPAVITDPTLANYLQEVGDRVIAAAQKERDAPDAHKQGDNSWMYSGKMKFHFVNSKTLNAFTTGGEHMYIYTALFQGCETEDELAAVVAHEFAHVYARHVQQGMQRQYGQMAVAGAVGVAAGAGAAAAGSDTKESLGIGAAGLGLGMMAGQFIGKGYTRNDENEADKYGFRFYVRAGWDPRHFADFFKRMIAAGYDTTPELASDHPTLASRVQHTERRISELPANAERWRRPPVANKSEFTRLKRRADQLADSMPSDKSLEQAQTLLAAFSSCVAPVDQPEQRQVRQQAIQAQQQQEKQKAR